MGRKGCCAFVFEEDGLGCPRLGWLFLPCFLSLALSIAGIAKLAQSSDEARERRVGTYNVAAIAWDSAAPPSPPYSSSPLVVSVWRAGEAAASANVSALFPLSSAAEDVRPAMDSGDGVRLSTRHWVLSYNASSASQNAIALALTGVTALDRQLFLAVSRPPQPQPAAGVPFFGAFSWETKPCLRQDTAVECRARCTELGASFTSSAVHTDLSVCTRVLILTEVCLVAANLDSSAPVADIDNGCALNNDVTREAPNLQTGRNSAFGPIGPFLYMQLPLGAPLPVAIAPKITVRSALDPWVVALRLSLGTGTFGASAARLAISGISLLIPGLILGPLLYMCCYAHHVWLHRHDEGSDGGSKSGQGSVAVVAASALKSRDAQENALEQIPVRWGPLPVYPLKCPVEQQALPQQLPASMFSLPPSQQTPPSAQAISAAAAAVAMAESEQRVAEAETAQLRAQVEAMQLKQILQQQQQLWAQQQQWLQPQPHVGSDV